MGRRPRLALAAVACVLGGCAGPHGHPTTSNLTTRAPSVSTSSTPSPPTAIFVAPSTTRATDPNAAALGSTAVETLVESGTERSYRLHTPGSFQTAERVPLVVVLHGASGNAGRVELRYHWDSLADRDGFFVVYPQGELDHWNATLDPAFADDVRFLTQLIDDLVRTRLIDPQRVYVAGMSNGGAMTYRVGCALGDRVAAIALVEGWNPGCHPAQPVSMVAVHGLADHEVSFTRAQQSIAAWRADDGCPLEPRVERRGAVTHRVWAPCAAGTAVEMYAVAGSGHEWPGSSPPLIGHDPPSPDLDATRAIWQFFQRHHK